jgi:aspartyl-tRNA synthetase
MVMLLKRTHFCGHLDLSCEGREVTVNGWIRKMRDFGKFVFVDLWDHTGLAQMVFSLEDQALAGVRQCIVGDSIGVTGKVVERKDKNPNLPTGEIEVIAGAWERYSASEPYPVSENPSEETRLKYRYLDLRTEKMQKNLRFRHRVIKEIRDHLSEKGFIEVETPILSKSTPEGARDYLVPSRLQPGFFYALPQSPQIYKQLLMIGGVDRYFQISRCFRDEDLRANRQPEFTQLDVEMAYADEEDIFSMTEALFRDVVRKAAGREIPSSFPRMTYQEAMSRYGSDKPDTRFDLLISDLTGQCRPEGFSLLEEAMGRGEQVKGLAIRSREPSRKEIDAMTALAKDRGAGGLMWFKMKDGMIQSPVAKFLTDGGRSITRALDLREGDTAFVVAAPHSIASKALGAVRLYLRDLYGLVEKNQELHFLWVTDFPMFFYNEDEKRYETEHHPFTMPDPDDMERYLDKDPEKIRSRSYDLVLNGEEIASGSVRNHIRPLQEQVFRKIGLSTEELQKRFSFFLKALQYGTPPHAGIAPGLDRFIQILLGEESIRDVIAFPKTTNAACLMTESPSEVSKVQLDELRIQVNNKN